MELLPTKLSVTVPVKLAERGGIHAVTKPFGVVTSFRATKAEMAVIDEAINFVDPTMSRGHFMRHAALYMAEAINQHILSVKKQVNDA